MENDSFFESKKSLAFLIREEGGEATKSRISDVLSSMNYTCQINLKNFEHIRNLMIEEGSLIDEAGSYSLTSLGLGYLNR